MQGAHSDGKPSVESIGLRERVSIFHPCVKGVYEVYDTCRMLRCEEGLCKRALSALCQPAGYAHRCQLVVGSYIITLR